VACVAFGLSFTRDEHALTHCARVIFSMTLDSEIVLRMHMLRVSRYELGALEEPSPNGLISSRHWCGCSSFYVFATSLVAA